MTCEELAALPLGSSVVFDDDEIGTIIQAGQEVWIEWSGGQTSIIYTKFKDWDWLLKFVEA